MRDTPSLEKVVSNKLLNIAFISWTVLVALWSEDFAISSKVSKALNEFTDAFEDHLAFRTGRFLPRAAASHTNHGSGQM